ncbi:head decoration protein [Stenotrophomonas terrae]|uniref:head decoration protein n=1 Tax=Stenotrophomonas terrae TaxID=405446 RepID=UPI0032088A74
MNAKVENNRTGDFLLSEANGSYSRENDILAAGAGVLQAGTVLGRRTSDNKLVPLNPAADPADGSEKVAGVLWAGADATTADVAVVSVCRAAEAKAEGLQWPAGITTPQQTTAIAQLAELGIVLR